MKIGGMSIADYIFADVTDVSGQDNTDACKGMSSISFEQRTLKSRDDYERKTLWSRGGVSRTPVFNPVFSTRVSLPAQCTLMIDSRSHDTSHLADEPRNRVEKEFPQSSTCFIMLHCVCGLLCVLTDSLSYVAFRSCARAGTQMVVDVCFSGYRSVVV